VTATRFLEYTYGRLHTWLYRATEGGPEKRRIIPALFALACFSLALTPLWQPWISEEHANSIAIGAVAAVFAFKCGLFTWMRHRMRQWTTNVTPFGMVLIDFFTALVLQTITLAEVFGTGSIYAWGGSQAPEWFRAIQRAQLIGTGAYTLATGIAVAWEMARTRSMRVRKEAPADAESNG
jgi:hypothetical protein